jgi:transposase InsO family protein
MSWKAVTKMDQKIELLSKYNSGIYTITRLSKQYGVSRKTIYKWINRFKNQGPSGLHDLPRVRRRNNYIDELTEFLILDLRSQHETWGASKLLAYLSRNIPDLNLPSRSTANNILDRHNALKKKNHFGGAYRTDMVDIPLSKFKVPNDTWCADYKGQFKLKNNSYCFPLTITDASTRYLLTCLSTDGINHNRTQDEFEKVFREYGVPKIIRTDNGHPFSSVSGLSKLSIWFIKHGVLPEKIQKGRPQQNGSHERMHRTLKEEIQGKIAFNIKGQQKVLDEFRREFNEERPHEAIDLRMPNELYSKSDREFKEYDPDYPSTYKVKTVSSGRIVFNKTIYSVTKSLDMERVGMKQVDNHLWNVYFHFYPIGQIDEEKKSFKRKNVLPM